MSDERALLERLLAKEKQVRTGYVTQVRDGKVRVIPWQESVTARDGSFKEFRQEVPVDWGVKASPRRTPAERLLSTFMRYHNMAVERQKQTGRYELPREMFKEMQLELWKEGTPLDEQTLRAMVARGLERAEREYRAAAQKRSTTENYHHQGVIEVRTR